MLRSVFIVYLILQNGFCAEPHCPRFHYEDQLLNKMIRMEVKVETMEKEILNTNKNVLEMLIELKQERESVKEDKRKFELEFDELKQNIATEAASVRNKLLTPTVVFKARQPADLSLETGQTLVLNTSMMNHGDGYDNVTGIFTAPVDGTYLFTMHVCLHSKKYFYYAIVCDNEIQTTGDFYEDSTSSCFTADAMMVLKTGQKVWIKCLLKSSSSDILSEYNSSNSNRWNTFSGMLIHK